MSTDLGIITIDPEVIAKYAGSVAVECFGIVGMAAVSMKRWSGKTFERFLLLLRGSQQSGVIRTL